MRVMTAFDPLQTFGGVRCSNMKEELVRRDAAFSIRNAAAPGGSLRFDIERGLAGRQNLPAPAPQRHTDRSKA